MVFPLIPEDGKELLYPSPLAANLAHSLVIRRICAGAAADAYAHGMAMHRNLVGTFGERCHH
jgi:hypothetical protein